MIIYMAKGFNFATMLLFGGDVKREIHRWLEDDDFKALLF
jgi:hypothetical protein